MTDLKKLLLSSVAAVALAGSAYAQATTEPAVEAEAEAAAENVAQATGNAVDATGQALQEGAAQTEMAVNNWDTTYGETYGDFGDRNVQELVGTNVLSSEGNDVGEVDNFVLMENQIAAVVGIGGFLGMGEHNVAIALDALTWDGENLVIAGFTEEELKAMPQYDEEGGQVIAADTTLRGSYEGIGAGSMEGASTDMAATGTAATPPSGQQLDSAQVETADATTSTDSTMNIDAAQTEEADAMASAEQQVEQEADVQEETEVAEGDAEATTEGELNLTEQAQAEQETPVEGATDTAALTTTDPATQPAEGSTDMAATTDATATDPAVAPTEGATDMAATTTTDQPAATDTQVAADERWNSDMDSIFGDIADRQVAELIGTEVASADGDVVGEVDNFALMGEQVVAIVGVGGFLGLGEHNVGLPLDQLTWDGERLVLSMTEEELKAMPEYDEAGGAFIEGENTLRGTYNDM